MSPITIDPTGNAELERVIIFAVDKYPDVPQDKALSQYLLDTFYPEQNTPSIENNDTEFWKMIADAKKEPAKPMTVEEIMEEVTL